MIRCICDHCGKELDDFYTVHIPTSDNEEVDLCEKCLHEFQNWLDAKPFCINTKEQERVDKLEERISNVELALGKMSNELCRLSIVLESSKKAKGNKNI